MDSQTEAVAHSPLAAHTGPVGGPHDAGVALTEAVGLRLLNLRGDATDKRFLDAVRKGLGTVPPRDPNTVAAADGVRILWLGPDEWLVVAPEASPENGGPDAWQALATGLANHHHSVTELSDNYAVVDLAGTKAAWVLAKGWPNDLHSSVFMPGHCAQGMLAHAQVILEKTGDERYRLYVRPSFAAYLWDWLTDAAGDVGYRIDAPGAGS